MIKQTSVESFCIVREIWFQWWKEWKFSKYKNNRNDLEFFTAISMVHIQMRVDAMTHLKYWFRISSILERTKNSTKTSNTTFERSDSGLPKTWRLGAWHSCWPATPTLYDKLTFLEEEGVASPWSCLAPVLQELLCSQSELSNEVLYVFVPFLLFQ